MTKREKMELLLNKVPEEQKAAFVAELREAKGKDAVLETVRKYNIQLADEEMASLCSAEVSDEDLDHISGGCETECGCGCRGGE